MAYEKQNFVDWEYDADGKVVTAGTTLKKAHLDHMEDGIAETTKKADMLEEQFSDMFESAVSYALPIRTYSGAACYPVESNGRYFCAGDSYLNVAVYPLEAGKTYHFSADAITGRLTTYVITEETLYDMPESGFNTGVPYLEVKTEGTAKTRYSYELTPDVDCYLYVQTSNGEHQLSYIDPEQNVFVTVNVPLIDVLLEKVEALKKASQTGIAYKVDEVNGIWLSEKYDALSDIQHYLCRHSLNNLFDLFHTWIYENDERNPVIHETDDTCRVIYGNGDWHAPFQIKAVNDINGDSLDGTYFTGGAHGYQNAGTDATPTARCIGVKFYADNGEIVAGETGYAEKIGIYWENYVQASNTQKADGTGREVLRECHTLTYKNGVFRSHVELIPMEDITVNLWYGFQLLYQSGENKSMYYIGSTNRAENNYSIESESGDNCSSLMRLVNNDSNFVQELYVDVTSDLGKRFMCHDNLTKSMFGADYGKAYCTIVNNDGAMVAGCRYVLDGEYRMYKNKTVSA